MFRILLVDDEAQERDGIGFLIRKYQLPLQIAEAQNGVKALEYIKVHPVDILFTDVKMPFMDGLELAKETFAWNPEIKIVIFSAYGEFEYAKKAMEAHAVDYLLKPIELDEFEETMKKVIGELTRREEERLAKREEKEESWKRILYKAFTGGSLSEPEQARLHSFFGDGSGGYKILISFECGGSLFEQREDAFLTLLAAYMPVPYEYVNLYPNEAFLLARHKEHVLNGDCRGRLERLRRDVKTVIGEELSIVVSKEFQDVSGMKRQILEVNEIKKNFYGGSGEILCLSDIVLNSEYYGAKAERVKELLIEAIENKEEGLLLLYADQLVENMVHGHVVSRIYVHHIFYDVLSALYTQYGIHDQSLLYENVEQLLAQRGGEALLLKWKEIFKVTLERNTGGGEDSTRVVEKLRGIIKDEYMQDLSLEELAGRVHLAPAYVSYLFKKETGSNLVKYITDYRMEKARRFLEDKELKIVQAARACGYENQPYFNRLFKNYYGMTPGQYREKNGK